MKTLLLSAVCFGLQCMTGCASGADIKDPGPDFGYIPNSIGIVATGRMFLESAALLDHDGSERGARLPVLLRTGIAEDWEFRAQVWALQIEKDSQGRDTGAGPIQLGSKYRVTEGGGVPLEPAWGFEGELLLPASTGGFDDGKVEPSLYFNVDHTIAKNGLFTWNVGALTPVDTNGDQFVQGYAAAAYSQFVSQDIQLYATGSLNIPDSRKNGGTVGVLGAGGYWYVSQSVVLYADYQFGVTEEAPTGLATLGMSLAF